MERISIRPVSRKMESSARNSSSGGPGFRAMPQPLVIQKLRFAEFEANPNGVDGADNHQRLGRFGFTRPPTRRKFTHKAAYGPHG